MLGLGGRGGAEYGPRVSLRESDSETYLLFAPMKEPPPHSRPAAPRGPRGPGWGLRDLNDPWGFQTQVEAGAPVGGLEAALQPGSLILKYTEMPSRAGLKSV